jgi:formylmethanofuran dehydrogenase subunit E
MNMEATDNIMESDEFKKCVDFHGHICPGLSMGYKAAKIALSKLKETRADDEEIVAIVETDACSADAVQVLTGCTFGKGNFIYKDYGKMALTLFSRKTGTGVRVSMLNDAYPADETHLSLLRKVMAGTADATEQERFQSLHMQRSRDLLATPDDKLFSATIIQMKAPAKARIEPSEPCSQCGEPTMRTKLELSGNKKICRGCLEQSG